MCDERYRKHFKELTSNVYMNDLIREELRTLKNLHVLSAKLDLPNLPTKFNVPEFLQMINNQLDKRNDGKSPRKYMVYAKTKAPSNN